MLVCSLKQCCGDRSLVCCGGKMKSLSRIIFFSILLFLFISCKKNENKDFRLEKITLNNSKVKVQDNGTIEILPDDYECDGFFIAKLRKMEEKC